MMRLFLALALLAAPPVGARQAQPPAPPVRPEAPRQPTPTVIFEPVAAMIAAFDADGDARVTRAEFGAGLRRSYDSVDSAKAGAIGYIAFADWAERWMGNRTALPSPFEVDRDGDNRITPTELVDRFELFFTRFDADKDGVLTRGELVTVRAMSPLGERLPGGAIEQRPRRR